jgi:hypothetical protein
MDILVFITLPIYLWLYSPLSGLGRFFSFFIFYTVDMTPWMGDQLIARPLPADGIAQTQNKRTETFMSQVGSEPTIPGFVRGEENSCHSDRLISFLAMLT